MPQNKLQVPIVVGTRPEAIKLVSLILALRASENYNPIVVSTGQHNRLVEYIFELADIKPDVTLWAGSRRAALNERVASVMQRFEDFCVERFDIDPDEIPTREDVLAGKHPALVLVHGDTSSAMAAALSAFHMRIPVMHVEAGLRTGGSNLTPFPEELNRQVISTIAAMHFAPTSENLGNLVRENVPVEQVFVTGNTGIDALRWSSEMNVQFANPDLQALCDSDRRIVVVTAHRRENWGDGLRGIAEGVARVADRHPEVGVVLPVHPNPRVREVLTERLRGLDNVLLTDPLGYATFSRLLGRAHLVITDSGGIQEEAPSLGKPVLVTRETTERTEGLAAGTLRLVGTDPQVIFDEANKLLTSDAAYREMAEAENPYGDGHAAERIVACLEHLLLGTNPPAQFGTGYSRAAVAIAAGMRSGRGVGVEALRQAIDEAALVEPTGTPEAVGTDPQVIFDEANKLLTSDEAYREMSEAENPYGDGRAAERIVACLEHLLLGTNPPSQFGTGYSRAAVAIAAGMRSGRGVGVEALRQAIDEAALSEPTAMPEAVGEAELETELIEQQEEAASMGGLSMLD